MADKAEFVFIGTNELDDTKIKFSSIKGSERGSILYKHALNDVDEYLSFSTVNSEIMRIGVSGCFIVYDIVIICKYMYCVHELKLFLFCHIIWLLML